MASDNTGGSLWRGRDFRLWWAGTASSAVGDQATTVAFPLLVLLVTGSPLQAGLIASVTAIPMLVLSIPLGSWVDRTSRRRVLVVSSALSALAVLSIPLAYAWDLLSLPQLYAVALVSATASTAYRIADAAVLPRIVGEAQIDRAVSQYETIWGISAIIGPPLAGFIFQSVGPAAPFALDALSFLVVLGCVASMRSRLGADPPYPPMRWRDDLAAGARAVLAEPLLRALTILTTAGDFLFAGIALLIIVIVRGHGADAFQTGLAFVGGAVGGILGSLLAPRVRQLLGLPTAVILKHWLTLLIFPLLVLNVPPVVTGIIWGAITFQVAVLNVIQAAYLLSRIGNDIMGRAKGFTTFLEGASVPLGLAMTGVLLDQVGTTTTVLAYSTGLLVLAVYASTSIRDRRPRPETGPTLTTLPRRPRNQPD
jgi:MFS family permease